MIAHLAGLAEERILLSFAPSTPYYEVLKRIGELFPKGAKVLRPPPATGPSCFLRSQPVWNRLSEQCACALAG